YMNLKVTINGRPYDQLDGAYIAGTAFSNFMQQVAPYYNKAPFPAPPSQMRFGAPPPAPPAQPSPGNQASSPPATPPASPPASPPADGGTNP
ncbi:hypothetical protein LJD40_26210, partial [Escherichia coli]|uniref:hypothetical protein n=1 Tax=Escherichia coli TaxID=562 RepID=UPI001D0A4D46